MKTGECYFRTENGDLWIAESFINEDGETYTLQSFIEGIASTNDI